MTDDHLALIKENIVSLYQAGAFFGSFFAYASTFFLGRRKSLWVFSLVFMLGAGMMLGASRDRGLGLIYGGRVLAGVGVGGCSMIVPIYISELAPPAIRGRLVGLYELGWQIGGLVGFWINYGIAETLAPAHNQWMIPFGVQLIPGGLLFIGAFWLRESPRWLITNGRRDEALKNLCWIRQLPADDLYLVEEVAYLDAALEVQGTTFGSGFWKPFQAVARSRKIQWRFFLGGMLFLFQNGAGINAINYYSPTIFASLGIVGTNTSFLTTGIFGVVKTSMTLVWLFFLIDRLGRRNMLLIGATGGAICMFIIGGYISSITINTDEAVSHPLSSGGIAAVFFFYLWTAFYVTGWNGTPWVLNSEIFPQNVRSLGQASAAANNWFWNFIIARFTPQMFLNMGKNGFGVYIFFACMMVVSIFFVFFLVPETKGIVLESMDRLFEIRPVWRAHGKILEEDLLREQEFRADADGAGLSVAKEKLHHIERTGSVGSLGVA